MKKSIILFLSALAVSFNIFACGGASQSVTTNTTEAVIVDGGKVDFDPSTIKTMGDFFKYKNEEFGNSQDGYSPTKYMMALEINNTYYRATADLPSDISEKLFSMDFEKRNETINELISPLPVTKLENLSEMIPSQDELNKYVGKTGKELFDEGWTYMYYNVEDVSAGLYHGPFLYDVTFEYNGPKMVNTDDFDFYKVFGEFKVKTIKYTQLGDAIELD